MRRNVSGQARDDSVVPDGARAAAARIGPVGSAREIALRRQNAANAPARPSADSARAD